MANVVTTTLTQRLYVNGTSASVIQTSLGITDFSDDPTFSSFGLDFSLGNNFNITLTKSSSNLDLAFNATAGQSGIIFLTQDSTGGRPMTFDASWRFPNGNTPSLTTTSGAVDGLVYIVRVGGTAPIISCQLIQNI